MKITTPVSRALGTMIAYGFEDVDLEGELALARWLGAEVLEVFPLWSVEPDPRAIRSRAAAAGFAIHSAHGCWGGQSIRASRVDLGHSDPGVQRESLDDLRRCIDWLKDAGGSHLVVHPGGLSEPEEFDARRAALALGLVALAEHARGTGVIVCVENMPPGVYPGSRMADLQALLVELGQPDLSLAIDTGHANIVSSAAEETRAAAGWLGTTHVHDNNGRQDTHLAPGLGTVDWDAWIAALDAIGYRGPIMLECIRHLRKNPDCRNDALRARLDQLCVGRADSSP